METGATTSPSAVPEPDKALGPRDRDRRRITLVPGGPLLVEGPVEVVGRDGEVVVSDRFVVALCVCRRSRRYPFCDTSHRQRVRQDADIRAPESDPG
ncbi:CDGSH iron-sulfur domain-containing protein [Streptomyces sp. NPDC094144]|uniref:CDGSH iron-sulfur domain-containing protein n=1 Tax=Streptomyces sp. NPDC094144 TaxID=3366056 RepID=UPI0037F80A59